MTDKHPGYKQRLFGDVVRLEGHLRGCLRDAENAASSDGTGPRSHSEPKKSFEELSKKFHIAQISMHVEDATRSVKRVQRETGSGTYKPSLDVTVSIPFEGSAVPLLHPQAHQTPVDAAGYVGGNVLELFKSFSMPTNAADIESWQASTVGHVMHSVVTANALIEQYDNDLFQTLPRVIDARDADGEALRKIMEELNE